MSAFKDLVERDVKNVFQNADEYAELRQVSYNGHDYYIPIILDQTAEEDRPYSYYAGKADHAEGLFLVSTTLYAAYEDMRCVPKKGQRLWVGDTEYYIVKSACEGGQIALGLEAVDE